jgi:hypothetical protein
LTPFLLFDALSGAVIHAALGGVLGGILRPAVHRAVELIFERAPVANTGARGGRSCFRLRRAHRAGIQEGDGSHWRDVCTCLSTAANPYIQLLFDAWCAGLKQNFGAFRAR